MLQRNQQKKSNIAWNVVSYSQDGMIFILRQMFANGLYSSYHSMLDKNHYRTHFFLPYNSEVEYL